MKKLLSLIIALAMVLSAAVCVTADFEEFEEEPTAYFWLKADELTVPSITFKIPGSALPANGEVTVTARVCFEEDCVATAEGGKAYVNCYSYADETKFNDFDYLISFNDFASSDALVKQTAEDNTEADLPVIGKWIDFQYTFDPQEATYASGRASTKVAISGGKATPEMLTVGIGFWNATGTVKVASLSVRAKQEVIWALNFAGGFDIDNEEDEAKTVAYSGITALTMDINWGSEMPESDIDGLNIAEGATCTIVGGPVEGDPTTKLPDSVYNASLTDGVASEDKSYDNSWFAFHANNGANDNATTGEVDGVTTKIGKAVIDLGETKEFNKVRAHCWAAGVSGIGVFSDIVLYISDDNTNWEEVGYLILGPEGEIYWAETSDSMPAQSARYVMLEYRWPVGAWGFTNEIQVIQADSVDYGDDSEPEPNESEPEPNEPEESDNEGNGNEDPNAGGNGNEDPNAGGNGGDVEVPVNGDAGIIALAVVSVIALGAAVIVKKSK